MSLVQYIKQIAQGVDDVRDLSEESACALFAAMLDGGVPDIELGAILMSLRLKTEALPELLGFHRALSGRVYGLQPPAGALRPLVFASYNGARQVPNLLPLLVLMLRRLGITVLVHGTLEGSGRVATAYILRELGILPCASLAQAQTALNDDLLAFVPTAVLAPGLAGLLALRSRLGVKNTAHKLVKLLDPFQGVGVRVVSASHPDFIDRLDAFFIETGFEAMLLKSTDGEPFANPRQRPRMWHFRDGSREMLFEEEACPSRAMISLPRSLDSPATAAWIRQALDGEVPIPYPLVNQLACCLFACGYTDDFNQAKAIAAVEAGGMAAGASSGSRNRAALP